MQINIDFISLIQYLPVTKLWPPDRMESTDLSFKQLKYNFFYAI